MAIFVLLRMMINRSIRGEGRSRIICLNFKRVYPDAQVVDDGAQLPFIKRNCRDSCEVHQTEQKALSERNAYGKRVQRDPL